MRLVRGLAVMRELTPRATDAISAYGERISSLIVAAHLRRCGMNTAHVDSRSVIVTDRRHTQAAPLFEETNRRLQETLVPMLDQRVVVMGGFIASTEDGVTTTLGRGGSDYTASIVGAGIGAEEIQIWTDVDGMLTADPTILPGALSRESMFVHRSRRAGVFRREGAASRDRAAGHREEYSGADSQLAPAGSRRHADRFRSAAVLDAHSVHRLQAQHHAV